MYERTEAAQHPLKHARKSLGLSQVAYARLIARELKEELGFEPQVRNHHQVLRWESGTVPQSSVQRAISRIHGISDGELERHGWPNVLYLVIGDRALLNEPWTPLGAINALNSTARRARAPRSFADVSGAVLRGQVHAALAALRHPQPILARDQGPLVDLGTLPHIETRIEALELQEVSSPSTPLTLYYGAVTEHQLVTRHLTRSGYDNETAVWLLSLALRTAALCGWLSICLGEYAAATSHYLAALRAAAATGSRKQAVSCMAELAFLQTEAGDPQDALFLVRAARTAGSRLSPRRTAVLYAREADALARLKDLGALRALELAERTLALAAPSELEVSLLNIDADWLAGRAGRARLHLGQHKEALRYFAAILDTGPVSDLNTVHSPRATGRLLHPVDAQLAIGEIDAAALTAHRAIAIAGTLPSALAHQYQQRFAVHRSQSPVKDLLSLLREHQVLHDITPH